MKNTPEFKRVVNDIEANFWKRVQALAKKAGALDSLGANRASLMLQLPASALPGLVAALLGVPWWGQILVAALLSVLLLLALRDGRPMHG